MRELGNYAHCHFVKKNKFDGSTAILGALSYLSGEPLEFRVCGIEINYCISHTIDLRWHYWPFHSLWRRVGVRQRSTSSA